MKRLAVILGLIACTGVVVVLGTGASNDDKGAYRVRAIFDSAFSVIPGEDVKVAGVKVGKIESLSVTKDKKAAVVLRIDKPGFGDFRTDATCSIRPQSLIGEKFVECTPTQPRAAGQPEPPSLKQVPKGQPGAGQWYLPVTNTTKTVDIDLLNNVLRLPYRQRLSIILNEFGTGLAGRGEDLNQVIRRADPALMETDKVLKILASQNKVLAKLAVDGDTNLAPLAKRRAQVADFVVKAGNVAEATAERRGDLEAQFEKFPAFLQQLNPTLDRLGSFSDEVTPVLSDLNAQAPAIARLVRQLGPFSEAGRESFPSLGDAAVAGRSALVKTKSITSQVGKLASTAAPVADDLEATLTSFRDTGGIERLMDYLFFQIAAVNGYDSAGHYLRAGLLVNTCSTYAIEVAPGCEATFPKGGIGYTGTATARAAVTSTKVADDPRRSLYLRREQRILNGEPVDQVLKDLPDKDKEGINQDVARRRAATRQSAADAPLKLPSSLLPGAGAPASEKAPAGGSAGVAAAGTGSGTTSAASSSSGSTTTTTTQSQSNLLDYLLGGGA